MVEPQKPFLVMAAMLDADNILQLKIDPNFRMFGFRCIYVTIFNGRAIAIIFVNSGNNFYGRQHVQFEDSSKLKSVQFLLQVSIFNGRGAITRISFFLFLAIIAYLF